VASSISQSTIVNCWRKVDILDNKNINYSIDLNNFELDIFFKEEIQKVTVDYIENYRKDYVELEEVDHLGLILLKVEDLLNKKIERQIYSKSYKF